MHRRGRGAAAAPGAGRGAAAAAAAAAGGEAVAAGGEAVAAAVAAGGGGGAAGGHRNSEFFRLSGQRHKDKVDSLLAHMPSVMRVLEKYPDAKRKDVVGTGTAFLVFVGPTRSLFLTADHNFVETYENHYLFMRPPDSVVDYPLKVHFRDRERDLALFSVQNIPSVHKCVEFGDPTVKLDDEVGILGYASPGHEVGQVLMHCTMVNKPSPFIGKIATRPSRAPWPHTPEHTAMYYDDVAITYYYKESFEASCTCSKGVSGSPVIKDDRVIGVFLASDKNIREAVTTNTVLQVMREWFKETETIENFKTSPFIEGTIQVVLQALSQKIEQQKAEDAEST